MTLPGLPSLFRRLLKRRAGGPSGLPSVALAERAARASVQEAYVSLEAVDGDVLCLRGGQYRAILEVEGVPFRLLRDGEQEALLAGWRAVLNGLTFPVQLLVRAVPRDLESHAVEVERRISAAGTTGGPPAAFVTLGHDYARYMRRLARRRTLMERRFYVVVPADLQPGRSAPRGVQEEQEDLVRRVHRLPALVAPWPFWRAGRRRAGARPARAVDVVRTRRGRRMPCGRVSPFAATS